MKKLIHENTLKIFDENNELINTVISTSYTIEPDNGKLLKDTRTNFTTDSLIGVGSEADIKYFEEINKE